MKKNSMARRKYRHVQRINVQNIEIGGRQLTELPVLVDATTGTPLFLPLLFTTFLVRNGFVFRQRRSRYSEGYLEKAYLTESTIQNYISALHLFLESLQEYSAGQDNNQTTPSANQLNLVDQRFVSVYLNEYLPPMFGSFKTLNQHRASIQSFFDWLSQFGLSDGLTATLRNDVRVVLGNSKKDKSSVVQYISREHRQELLRNCKTERDRLILRTGFELGLRTSENLGLVIEKQRIQGILKPGLGQLFEQLRNNSTTPAFEYWLNGRYCKGGRSRPLQIPRRLLTAMSTYFDGERKRMTKILGKSSDHLFINYSRIAKAEISNQFATDLFRSLRSNVENLDRSLSYHDLRHTFGTELYASLVGPEGHGRSEQRALTIVQDRLGHSDPRSTLIYVHLFEQMQLAEGIDIVG